MPQEPRQHPGQPGWGGQQQQSRRPEAAYEETGAMSAQPYDSPPPHGPRPSHPGQPGPQQSQPVEPGAPGRRRAPGSRRRAPEQETRTYSNEETIASDAPRRSRRAGGGPGGPGGPPAGPPKGGGDKPRWRRFLPSWKLVLATFVVLSGGMLGMIMVAYSLTPVPREDQIQEGVTDQESVIVDRNGVELARLGTKRIPVKYDQVPRPVQDAVIAAENDSFREDSGISFSGMVRSLWSTVSGQQVQGASTITQQMARGYYDGLSQERSIQRKIKEIFVAVKLNKVLPKETILEQYLNTIYFGRGAYGIGAASKAFFGKPVEKLTPEQGAYLAGRIQNPGRFDREEEAGNNGVTEFRYKYVIGQMAKLDPQAYGNLAPKSPKRIKYKPDDPFKGLKGYMVQTVLDELERLDIPKADVYKGGYHVKSSLDLKLMRAARAAVKQHIGNLDPEINATLAAVDPRNGQILAFYAGEDYAKDQWNDAFLSQKQAASAFKPYVLAAWLDAGYSLRSYVPAKGPVKLDGTTPIDNDHSMKASAVDVVSATASSVNTAYAKMGEKVGLDKVIDIAAQAGLNKDRLEAARKEHHYLLTIGSSTVTAVEQAGGYSIFANQGRHYENHVVIEVKDKDGKTVISEKKTYNQVISPEAAADAVVALEAVVKSGTGRSAALPGRPVAGKTGTNNDNKEAWFVGFTPQVSTAVGLFRQQCRTASGKVVKPKYDNCPWAKGKSTKYTMDNPYSRPYEIPLGPGFQGATYPAAIWKSFMLEATKGQKVVPFPERADAGITENLVPKPTPTPTPTRDATELDIGDPFDEDDFDVDDCVIGPCGDDDGNVSIDPNQDDVPVDDGLLGGGRNDVPAPSQVRRGER
ncbi:MAG TPA: transglycosylase domain-containing protein [Nonomuraea sp.]|nr:transglycosylase domain-containing protein [Nonomuraea sp.]